MVELKDKQLLIDGEPRLIMCGEIHYFRLRRDEWQDRIDKLKAAGCNAVASYVPWLCHEPVAGQFDLDGHTRPELDLAGFIDLCRDNDLLFLVRPGPFIMAEIKNEGVPFWVYEQHPEAMPVSWDGEPVPTRTLDYLAPGFLAAARNWYRAVMGVIAPRLQPVGGNIIAVQLDNEIGMLSWVANRSDLTDQLLDDFVAWLRQRYDQPSLQARYPFDLDEVNSRNVALRSPREEYAPALLRDLGHYMRHRFARYVATLRGYAEEFGVTGVPFVINIHGTADSRGLPFPLGISQLYESYTQAADYLAGSDHYLGDLDANSFQDLYLINALMDAVNLPNQPLSSVEFEAGSGDYGETYGGRYDPSAVDFKIRMCVAQGNRLLNYYLFCGGTNYRLPEALHDGNDRIAFTGERHGFAAPVNPEGELNYTYAPLARATRAMMAVADRLAVAREEHDRVAFGFIPDYYMTESRYPSSAAMQEIVGNLEANRGPGAWEIMARAMLLAGYRFGAVDIQSRDLDPQITPAIALGSARYMDGAIQQRLVDYLTAGGGLLLYGELPRFDMEARPCTILSDALGLTPVGSRQASPHYFLSLVAEGWAAPRPEVRTHYAQGFVASRGEVLLRVYDTGEACGFDIPLGSGRAILLTTAYRCDIALFRSALERLGATAALRHDSPHYGIFMTSTASEDGARFLHLLNLDGFAKTIHLTEHGQPLLDGRALTLESRAGIMLPLNLRCGDTRIVYSTAEIAEIGSDAISFRLTQPEDVIAIETDRRIVPSAEYRVEQRGTTTLIVSNKPACLDDRLVISF
ncbi:MAG: beta-galactosidase [Chloroflexi bacterium]|nr:beta-galactosidase [Chloroflexota bacterium]